MSYADNFYKALEKKKKKNQNDSQETKASNTSKQDDFSSKFFSALEEKQAETESKRRFLTEDDDDIAPVRTKSELLSKKEELEESKGTFGDFALNLIAGPFGTEKMQEKADSYISGNKAVDREISKIDEELAKLEGKKTTTKGGNKDSVFKSGTFSDGYQSGDLTKGVIGTTADVALGILKGAGRMVEGVVDLAPYAVAGVADLVGADKFAESQRNAARLNVVDELTKDATEYVDKYSFIGNKAEGVTEGLGQIGAVILTGGLASGAGLGALGTSAVTTGAVGLSSMGSSMGEAYEMGATDGEAFTYGLTTGTVEAASELIFGGLGRGFKALGISKGLTSVDDVLAKKISSMAAKYITSEAGQKAVGNTIEYVVKSGAEGLEEVIAGLGTSLAKDLVLLNDEDEQKYLDIVKDENLLEQFVVGSIVSGIAQGGDLIKTTKSGADFITGYTQTEDKVINKVVEKEIAEREANGEKLTSKEKNKIYDSVVERVENGSLGVETIEEVLGGESYEAYKKATDENTSLKKELDELNDIKASELTGKQSDRLAELKGMNLGDTSKTDELKKKWSDDVFNLVRNDRNGQGSMLLESYREVERRKQAFTADLTKYNGKQKEAIERAINSGVLNNTNRSHELVNILSKIEADKGISFDYTNNAKLKESGFAIEGKTVNGYVKDGGVTLNMESAKAWESTVGHEITHVLEGTKAYGELQSALFKYAESKGELETRRSELTKLYNGIDADIDAELTADLVGDYLFNDKNFVKHLTSDRNVFQKVWDEVKYLYNVATGKEKAQIEKVMREFEKAWKELGKGTKEAVNDEGVKLSISETTDGRIAAVVESDILSKIDTTTWDKAKKETAKKAASDALKQFSGGIVVNGVTRKVNRQTRKEYTRSDYTEKLYRKSPEMFADKMRASDIADDIVVATTNWNRDGGLKHPRDDNFVDFDHGTTLIVSGNAKYSAEVVVGITQNGEAVFYDVVDMMPTTFEIKKAETSTTATTQDAIGDIQEISTNGSLAHMDGNVNTKFSISSESNYKSAIERGDTETAQKIVDEAAKNAGYDIKAYHGTGYDFTVFDKSKQGSNYEDWGRLGKGFYFAPTSREAETWAEHSKGNLNKVMPVYLRSENMLDSFEALPDDLKDTIPADWEGLTRRLAEKYAYNYIEYMQEFGYDVQKILTEKGYDGINGHTEFVVFDPEQVKSADAITYDDKGNVIPLAERFNAKNEDIRYSLSEDTKKADSEYMLAVENGDMETAQRLVNEAAEKSGYTTNSEYRGNHYAPYSQIDKESFTDLDKLQELCDEGSDLNLFAIANGISIQPDDYFGPNGARWYGYDDADGMEAYRAIKSAMNSIQQQMEQYGEVKEMPTIKVYRAVPKSVKETKLQSGGQWVTPSYLYAKMHGEHSLNGKYKIIEEIVSAENLWWDANDIREWGFDDGTNYAYRDTKNNRKLLDAVTYDDEGNVIPLSKRFNHRNADERYSLSNEGEKSTVGTPLSDLYYEQSKAEDIAPVDISKTETTTTEMFPDDYAPATAEEVEALSKESFEHLSDEDAPPEIVQQNDYLLDDISIDIKSLKQLSKSLGEILPLTDKFAKADLENVIQDFSTGKIAIQEDLYAEVKKRFSTYHIKERYDNIEKVKHAVRMVRINVSDNVKADFDKSDYGNFVRKHFGKIRFSKEGMSVDRAYQALSGAYPDLFPDSIWNEADQLRRIAEVVDTPTTQSFPQPVDEGTLKYVSEMIYDSVQEYKDAVRLSNSFEAENAPIDESLMPPVDEFAESFKAPSPDEISPMTEEEANALQAEKSNADAELEGEPKTRKQLHNNIINDIKATFSSGGFDFDEVLRKAKNLSTFSTVDNIPQRVMEKALGYKEGQVLSDLTVNKVAQNETEGIKWLNSFTDRKNGLLARISKQYDIKPGSKESAAAQMYAEGFYVADNDDIIAYGDAELAKDFPNEKVRNNIKGLARDPRIRQIYDETLDAINSSRTRNAYPEIGKLDNYFLHFRAMEDTFSKLGLPFNPNDIRAKDLPTDLNGVTADLKPGQPYFASAMHRKGKRTSFDLLGGLERYLTSAKNQIYHIDDIQTLRALRNYIADTYGQANGLEGIDMLTEEEAQERIKEVYGSHLSTFAKFLNEEANVLAGKTALIDRGLEGIIGRRGMTFFDTVNKQVGSNMVGFNVSSSLTNFIPVAQTFAKTNKFDFLKAFTQTASNKFGSIFGKGDNFAENSPVIIRRKGADRFYRTPFQKVGDAGYVLMSAVDNISTELIARTKFNEFTRKGMSEQQAHFETDKWVSRLMGDRSLGQQPQMYNSKMLGIITKFQLEVRNQLDSQFYDTIQEAKVSNEEIENRLARNAKTAAKVTSTFVQLAVAQHLFGKAFESIAGYNPAFDIISVLATAFGFDDDEESEDTVLDNVEQGFLELLEDLPYTSTFTGGRIPISSALPIEQFIKGKDSYGNEKSRLETLGEVAPYYVLPGGYGQIKKTTQGLGMFSDEHPVTGSYTDIGNLRFPVEDTPLNRVQAGLFGQYASKNAREYFDNDYAPLNEKQIKEYQDIDLPISDYWKIREGFSGLTKVNEKGDYIGGLDLPVSKKNILMNNRTDRKTPIDFTGYENYSNFEEFDFAQRYPEKYAVLKEQGISVADYKENHEETAFLYTDDYSWAANNPESYAVSKAITNDVTAYKQYTTDLYNIKADKDVNGKSISGSRKNKVLDYINNLDVDYEAKLILFKSEYPSDDTYNYEIIEYLNNRQDLTYDERVSIYEKLGFTVKDGYVYWD